MNGALNRLWRPVSVTGFSFFVLMEGRFVSKNSAVSKISGFACGHSLRACLYRGGEPQVGEVTSGGPPGNLFTHLFI